MDQEVYIVYEGNQYLQNLTVKGVYTDWDDAADAILYNHRFKPEEIVYFDEDDEDDKLLTNSQRREIADSEIQRSLEEENGQICGFRTGYMIKPINLNEWQ